MAVDHIRRVRVLRKRTDEDAKALAVAVYEAMQAGHKWPELAAALGVKRARVYQLRAQGEQERRG